MILDRGERKLLAMLSRMGGMDVEEMAETDPDALIQRHIEPGRGLTADVAREIAVDAGIDEDVTDQVAEILDKLDDIAQGRGRHADRDQPADRHRRSQGRRPRLEDDDRRQRLYRHPELAEFTDKSAEDCAI